MRAVYGQQITVENAGPLHAQSPDLQQIIGTRSEQQGIELVTAFDMLGGQNGAAGGDPADYGNARCLFQPDAARGTGSHLECAFAGQGAQVFFGRIGRAKTHGLADLGAGRWIPRLSGVAADEFQNFCLAWREFVAHDSHLVTCNYIQYI
ncbi:hypothetical protein D3C83_26720 [compost metagenome]